MCASACFHNTFSTLGVPGQPGVAWKRARTRLTLPSKMAVGLPKAMLVIAWAVDLPIPGKAINCSGSLGISPLYSSTTVTAHLCRLRARA